jgi:hypothetical protein
MKCIARGLIYAAYLAYRKIKNPHPSMLRNTAG